MKTEGKVILNEIELETVNGGSEAYLVIYELIRIGDESSAKKIYEYKYSSLSNTERIEVRRSFSEKFGHAIDRPLSQTSNTHPTGVQ